jgi:hypothetical protein
MQLYDESIDLQKKGDPAGSTEKYLKALEIQARLKSIPLDNTFKGQPWWLPLGKSKTIEIV